MLQALDMEAVQPILEHYLTIEDTIPEHFKAPLGGTDFVARFKTTAWTMREYVHATKETDAAWEALLHDKWVPASAMLPSPKERSQHHINANGAMVLVCVTDPEWLAGYIRTLSPKHKELVRTAVAKVAPLFQ